MDAGELVLNVYVCWTDEYERWERAVVDIKEQVDKLVVKKEREDLDITVELMSEELTATRLPNADWTGPSLRSKSTDKVVTGYRK